MNPREFAIKVLQEKGEVTIRCNGNSMRPIIAPKEAIHLRRVNHSLIRVGDAVFCRINGNLQVHKVTAIQDKRFQISNNHGHVNGWIGANSIFGLAVQIEDRVLVSDAEFRKRDAENEIPPDDWKPTKDVQITKEDAEKLRGEPGPLKVLVPVEIEEAKRAEVGAVHRIICMDEVDLECPYCGGLVAYSFCSGKDLIHCVHCGNPMKTAECKSHKAKRGNQQVPRHAGGSK